MSIFENDHVCKPSPMDMVDEFHRAFALPVRTSSIDDMKQMKFRLSLIQEEYMETVRAMHAGDNVQMLDGLADMLYVIYGCAIELGWDLDEALRRVHASNMTKLWEDGPHTTRDGKAIKPDTFEPPVLGDLVGE